MPQSVDHAIGVDLGSLQIEYDGPPLDARALGVFHLALDRLIHQAEVVLNEGPEVIRTAFWIETYNKFLDEIQDASAQLTSQDIMAYDSQLMELRKHIRSILVSVDNPELNALVNHIARLRAEIRRGFGSEGFSLDELARRYRIDPRLQARAVHFRSKERTVKAIVTDIRTGSLYETLLFIASQPDARAVLQNFAANLIWLVIFSGSRAVKKLVAHKHPTPPTLAVTAYRKERVATLVERLVKTLCTSGEEGAELRVRHTTSHDREEIVITLKIPKRG